MTIAETPPNLYRPGRLATIDAAAARWQGAPARYPPLPATGQAFLGAAHHAARRATRRRRGLIAGLLALAVIAVSAAGLAVHDAANASRQAANAARQHAVALSRQLAAESLNIDATEPVTARRLAVAAWAISPTGQAASAITTLLAEQQQQGMLPADSSNVFAVAFSPGGNMLASAGGDGTVRLWNLATGRTVKILHASARHGVYGVAFSPGGNMLASADGDGTVRLWNPVTGRVVKTLHASAQTTNRWGVRAVAFSPDGKLLASAGADGTVRLWNPATGRAVGAPLHASAPHGVSGVAFSPDGKLLATADGDGSVRLWNPATGPPADGVVPSPACPPGPISARVP